MNVNRTLIITAANAPLARALAAGLAAGGAGMFETPLYTGVVLTHYISSGWIDAQFDAVLTDANALFAACGGAATLVQCQELISTGIVVDCDAENAQATIARFGLHLSNN